MSEDKYTELERAFIEQGRNFAKTLKAYEAATDRIAELEANSARLISTLRVVRDIISEHYASYEPVQGLIHASISSTPADSLAAVKRQILEAQQEMREKIAAELESVGPPEYAQHVRGVPIGDIWYA